MSTIELVFIPAPGAGHLASMMNTAKLLLDHDPRLSITVLIFPSSYGSYTVNTIINPKTSFSTVDHIRFIDLPHVQPTSDTGNNLLLFFTSLIKSQKPHVREVVNELVLTKWGRPDSPRLAGFVFDMLCTPMMEVAKEFGVPSYLYFTSGAAFLGLQLYIPTLREEQKVDMTELKDSNAELVLPCLVNPVSASVLPSIMLDKDSAAVVLEHAIGIKNTRGILVNTFTELELHVIRSLEDCNNNPTIYPVGPILNLKRDADDLEIMKWLDGQPPLSVVFLCFGSMGSFSDEQVREIAYGLEQSGYRFLWSLRKAPSSDQISNPTEFVNLEEVLPEGFLDRTAEKGKIIGWAPQVEVLGHPAVGGFVSHCGWNSVLESIWYGVPTATWPLYAEQQMNAFEMVVELGLAVEIKMDYRREFGFPDDMIVKAEEIEKGIKRLMEEDKELRKRVKVMSEKSRNALTNGGSSQLVLTRFIADVIGS
ncbi:anthocyanidin 3-O-glucosyltransferase 2-like [Carica papaya]|uniref:anthocyanidin 3-O-glucosyltransferase 2-like n=1 Tax=Carica papaya TaxID=3649 RepID=UPI000B8CF732|nr:anthocyanidin 3-O-glucosyltransferase 2-like [Carica papaya]